jgi:hypothetical protein
MKIVRLSKDSNLTRIEKTFNWFRFSGRGPAGTISSLDTLDLKAVVVAADLTITGDSADSFTNKKSTWQQIIDSVLSVFLKISNIQSTIAGLLITVLNLQTKHIDFTPGTGDTVTIDQSLGYSYTITPSGSSFTLVIIGIPASGLEWSITIYAIDWDGVTVTMPAGSVTPGSAGLSFTSGGGKDRLAVEGHEGPSGEIEFYNLPGDMG